MECLCRASAKGAGHKQSMYRLPLVCLYCHAALYSPTTTKYCLNEEDLSDVGSIYNRTGRPHRAGLVQEASHTYP